MYYQVFQKILNIYETSIFYSSAFICTKNIYVTQSTTMYLCIRLSTKINEKNHKGFYFYFIKKKDFIFTLKSHYERKIFAIRHFHVGTTDILDTFKYSFL